MDHEKHADRTFSIAYLNYTICAIVYSPLPSFTSERFRLSRAVSLSGTIEKTSFLKRKQIESAIGSDGGNRFANLAPGCYALFVLYGDQTVIAQTPNVETTVNAFAVYTLHRPGDPFGLPFRTNQRGEFSIEDVPIGTLAIGPSNFGRTEDKEVICVPQVIREGVTSLATSDLGVLCVLLIDENYTGWFDRMGPLRADLHGPVESQVYVEMAGERSRDGFQRLLVFGRTELPSGTYSADIEDGPVEFNVDFKYQRNQTPVNILLSHHWLSSNATRNRSGSMGGVKATLMRNKRSVSSTYLPFESSDKVDCLVQSTGPFEVLVHDFSNGYALLKNVSFSGQMIDLWDIVWKPGAKLVVSVNLSRLDVFPEKVSIRHEETGISFSETWAWNSSAEFANVPPGKWFIEVTSTDPLLGKRTLISREMVVVQPEDVHLELRR